MVYLTGCSESNGTYCFGILPDFFSITNESVPCRDSFLNTAKMKWPNFTNIFYPVTLIKSVNDCEIKENVFCYKELTNKQRARYI